MNEQQLVALMATVIWSTATTTYNVTQSIEAAQDILEMVKLKVPIPYGEAGK